MAVAIVPEGLPAGWSGLLAVDSGPEDARTLYVAGAPRAADALLLQTYVGLNEARLRLEFAAPAPGFGSAAWSTLIPGTAASHFIFRPGDYANAFSGLGGWNPITAPTAGDTGGVTGAGGIGVVEPGGVVGLAAILNGRLNVKGKVVVAMLSGGNVDPETFAQALRG